MKRFRFKLQTLLDQRKAHEDRLLAELAELRAEESAELDRLARLNEDVARADNVLAGLIAENAGAAKIALADEYARARRDDVKLQELTLDAVQNRVQAKLVEVTEAMKQRKVLEALRDKQEQAFILAQMRAEQNQLDEIASVRYARGM